MAAARRSDFQESTMSEAKEKWKELCEQVMAERDPKRLTELVAMLNDELEKREPGKKIAFAQQNPSKNWGRTVS
jgi:hypothetical protein